MRKKTGGGVGTNQYGIRGTSKRRYAQSNETTESLTEVGRPGGWLGSDEARSIFGSTVDPGKKGEIRTAAMLRQRFANDSSITIYHDLGVPGLDRANVDHAVVKGNQVILVDSKMWGPGNYWKLGSKVFRGLRRFPPAEKLGTIAGIDRWSQALQGKARVSGMILVHSSSTDKPMKFWFGSLHQVPIAKADRGINEIAKKLRWSGKHHAPDVHAQLTDATNR